MVGPRWVGCRTSAAESSRDPPAPAGAGAERPDSHREDRPQAPLPHRDAAASPPRSVDYAATEPVGPSSAAASLSHARGIRSTLAAHTKSFSDNPRTACVVKVTRQ